VLTNLRSKEINMPSKMLSEIQDLLPRSVPVEYPWKFTNHCWFTEVLWFGRMGGGWGKGSRSKDFD
jgi:hypothetical protein